MRAMLLAVAAATAITASAVPAAAQQRPSYQWCAQYDEGGTNCGFITLSQCNGALSGNGGFCERNGMAGATAAPAPVTSGGIRRRTTVGAAASQ